MKTASVREKLRDTATILFSRRGARAVSVDEIVVEAGVSKPSFYRAYPSKDMLVVACVSGSAGLEHAQLDSVLAMVDATPADRIRALTRYIADAFQAEGYLGCMASNIAIEYPDPAHPVRAIVRQTKLAYRERLVVLCAPVGAPGAERLADHILLLLEGGSAVARTLGPLQAVAGLALSVEALIASVPALSQFTT